MNTRRMRKIRLRLFKLNPHCCWCGRLTVWWARAPKAGVRIPLRIATLDHLHPVGDPLRVRHVGCACQVYVLACRRCNNSRLNPYVFGRANRDASVNANDGAGAGERA